MRGAARFPPALVRGGDSYTMLRVRCGPRVPLVSLSISLSISPSLSLSLSLHLSISLSLSLFSALQVVCFEDGASMVDLVASLISRGEGTKAFLSALPNLVLCDLHMKVPIACCSL